MTNTLHLQDALPVSSEQRYQEAFEAGERWGKAYRRAHRSWSSDVVIARRAARAVSGTYQSTPYFDGVLKGLAPFSSEQFAATFERNAEAAIYHAEATLGGIRLQVHSQDAAHYQRTLAVWKKAGATVVSTTGYVHA